MCVCHLLELTYAHVFDYGVLPQKRKCNFFSIIQTYALPLAAKGSVDLYVWIIIVDGQLLLGHENISKEARSHDLTPALREEVLHCTTAGVRLSTEKSMKATEYHSKIVHYLEQIQSPNPEIAEVMTLRRFIQILFNYGEEGSDDHKSSGGSLCLVN